MKNIWNKRGNKLLYKGEDVGMIGWCKERGGVRVDMISYLHDYGSEDIKELSKFLWFIEANEKINRRGGTK